MISQRAYRSIRAVQRVMMTLMTLSWASWRAVKLLHFHLTTSFYIHNQCFSGFANRNLSTVSKGLRLSLIVAGSPPKGTPMQVALYRSSSAASFKNSFCSPNVAPSPLSQASFVEEEIDRLNESFLRLSVELQNRTRPSLQPREGDGSVGNHSAVISTKNCIYNQPEQFVFSVT